MSRAEEFIALYNELDRFIRRQLTEKGERVDASDSFKTALARVRPYNPAIRVSEHDIKEMADLRNAIIHQSRAQVIAEPTAEVVEELRGIVEKVTNPRRAHHIGSKNVRVFGGDQELSGVLIFMKEHQYSQVVVRESGIIRLLSSVGITRWLEQKVPESILELDGVTLSAALEHEPRGSYKVTGRTTLADGIREMFLTPPSGTTERLQAVIVTHSGKSTEEPVGIITPWDLAF